MIPDFMDGLAHSPFLYRMRRRTAPLVDYEQAPGYLGVPSTTLEEWSSSYDGRDITLSSESGDVYRLPAPGVVRVAFSLDQNNSPVVVYEDLGGATIHVADTARVITLPGGSKEVLCTMDDWRSEVGGLSDVVVAYRRGNTLFWRVQRERYEIEHAHPTPVNGQLVCMGMTKALRLQIKTTKA